MTALPVDARLGVAAITIWEAAMLEGKGRVIFHPNLDSRVREMLDRSLCALVPLLPEIALPVRGWRIFTTVRLTASLSPRPGTPGLPW